MVDCIIVGTNNTMSRFELLTLLISSFALLISLAPLFISLYKKLFLPLRIKYVPHGKCVLIFNESGPYLRLAFVLFSKNKSIIVNKIEVIVKRFDGAELKLFWKHFTSPIVQIIGSNNVSTHEAARPFKTIIDNAHFLDIGFSNANDKVVRELELLHDEKMDKFSNWNYLSSSYDEGIAAFKAQDKYQRYHNRVLEELYWRAGEYSFRIITTYDDTHVFSEEYSFSITDNEYHDMIHNVSESLICRMKNNYGKPSAFRPISKEYELSKKKVGSIKQFLSLGKK